MIQTFGTHVVAFITICCYSVVAQTIEKYSAPDNSLSFLVVGDWGRHGEFNQKDVAASMAKAATHLDAQYIVSTGDNFYPVGVASVHDPAWEQSFENIYTAHSLQVPWYVVPGNHDYHGSVQAEIDYSKISRRWRMPSRYFDTTIVDIHATDTLSILMLCIDTNPFQLNYQQEAHDYSDLKQQDTSEQKEYIERVLKSSKATWKIVVGHHPMYTGGKRKGKTEDMLGAFNALFKKYKVDAYFAGHEHDLQHHDDGTGVQYFVSGAGSEVRTTGNLPNTKFAASTPGFATVTASTTELRIQFVDTDGKIVYSTLLKK